MVGLITKTKEAILTIPTLVSLITAVTVIIGSFLTIDTRYAHADALVKLEARQQEVINQNRADLQVSTSVLRQQLLEDKIFDLEIIPESKRTSIDNARLNKYKRNLEETNRNISKNSNSKNMQ